MPLSTHTLMTGSEKGLPEVAAVESGLRRMNRSSVWRDGVHREPAAGGEEDGAPGQHASAVRAGGPSPSPAGSRSTARTRPAAYLGGAQSRASPVPVARRAGLSACGSAQPAVCLPPGITRSAASSSGCLTQGRTHQQNPRGASGVRPGRLRCRQEVGDSFSRVCWQSHTCPLPWVLLSPSLSGAGEGGRLGAPRDCSPPSQQPTGPRMQLPAPDILARPPAVCPRANRPTPLSPGFCLRKWES